jgi:NADPH:quinone reductase-like Zn-dependent oxidoreductase
MRLHAPAGIDRLALGETRSPRDPGPGQIQVRLCASSLNYHDYVVVTGGIRTPDGRIPMSDGAGEVIAVGDGVTGFCAGDAVVSTFFSDWADGRPREGAFGTVPGDTADGYARECVVAAATSFTRAPIGYSHAEAATLPCAALTAWRALVVEGGIKAGDSVLVQGSGGVSIFALQFAKAMGATVIATSSSDAKLDRLKALGADHGINYRTTEKWGSAAREWAGGGVDHVVEVGGAGTLAQSISAARQGGHISVIGVLTGHQAPVPTTLIMAKQLRVIGISVGTHRQQREMIAAIEAIGIKPVIDAQGFELDRLADAFRFQEAGGHFGKIVVEI